MPRAASCVEKLRDDEQIWRAEVAAPFPDEFVRAAVMAPGRRTANRICYFSRTRVFARKANMQVLPPLNAVPSGHNSVLEQTPKETAGNSRVTAKLLAELGAASCG